jgi:voltage-gated potassium channel Kch
MTLLLAGDGRLADAIADKLAATGTTATRISIGELTRAADLQNATALLLAADDDAGNVDLALAARRLRAGLPLVVRLFDAALAGYLGRALPDVVVLSMSATSAPAFTDAVLRSLREPARASPSHPIRIAQRRRRWQVDRILAGALLALLLLVIPSTVFFSSALNLSTIDALYFIWTTITTVGYGDIALREASDGAKLVGMMMMLAGAAFIAVLFALLADWVLARRLSVLQGRVRVRGRGHVIVVGAGNIGYRVAGELRERGKRVVVIEKAGDNRHVEALRAVGHHVIIADATSADVLGLAQVGDAATVVTVTESDSTNLQVVLLVRALVPGVPLVMRADSRLLSEHVTQAGDAVAISPVDVAAGAFVDAALVRTSARGQGGAA